MGRSCAPPDTSWPRRLLLALLFLLPPSVQGTSLLDSSAIDTAAGNWLAGREAPLGERMSRKIRHVQAAMDAEDAPLYYVVQLDPEGFVVMSADRQIEPVITFSGRGFFDFSPGNPLKKMLDRDLKGRRAILQEDSPRSRCFSALCEDKWARLLAADRNMLSRTNGVSNERVAPILSSRWGQGGIWMNHTNYACFNYYTPPYAEGSCTNYPAGCSITSWAQLMRYYRQPQQGIGTHLFTNTVDNLVYLQLTRGGDGFGGPYDWDHMPLMPTNGASEQERRAIGALCFDIGVVSRARYTAPATYSRGLQEHAVSIFGFSNVVECRSCPTVDLVEKILNPCLDAGCPVILAVYTEEYIEGHSLVCDGYGFVDATLFHHLNMGWNGNCDAWYSLPDIDIVGGTDFSIVAIIAYNIFTEGAGEIVSGRVLDESGVPIASATGTLHAGAQTLTALSDTHGILAFRHVNSGAAFTVTVAKAGHRFLPRNGHAGASQSEYNCILPGNVWGLDFISNPAPLPDPPSAVTASDGESRTNIAVSWTASENASTYRLYRSEYDWADKQPRGPWSTNRFFSDTSNRAGFIYYYAVVASNVNGASSFSTPETGWRNAWSNDPPTAVSASDGSFTDRIHVTWNRVPGANWYRIYRATSEYGEKTNLATLLLAVFDPAAYSDLAAEPCKTYCYWLRSSQNNIIWSEDYSVPDAGWRWLPSPTGLTASVDLYIGVVRVTWQSPTNNVKFQVWRATAPDGAYSLASGWLTNCFLDDATVQGGMEYYYKVMAMHDSAISSDFSSNVMGRATGSCPGTPTGVHASDGTYNDRVSITWEAYMSVLVSCRVSRADTLFGPKTVVSGWQVDHHFNDTAPLPGKRYYYSVQAMNQGVASGFSWPDQGYINSDDLDQDHVPNWAEFVAGTDAMDSNSFLRISHMIRQKDGLVLHWPSEPARAYTIQRGSTITNFDTTIQAGIPATPSLNVHTDSTAEGSVIFHYRILVDQ